jgi:L-alanine-DL-glutamate epimerase-like enolase superfamily enzyme
MESWPLKQPFTTSQFSITQSLTLTVELRDGDLTGRGECEPHEQDTAIAQEVLRGLERSRSRVEAGIGRQEVPRLLPPGPARNALDCALWDLEAKKAGRRAWELAGVALEGPLTTAYTISLDTPEAMAAEARSHRNRPLLKLKLGKQQVLASVEAVRSAAPDARLIVDVNGAWNFDDLQRAAGPLAKLGVEQIEQPLPAGGDAELAAYRGPIPLCADESCLDAGSLDGLSAGYSCVNIKLDKTGGLTEALRLVEAARRRSLGVMVGCMNGTSLAIAPAMVIGAQAGLCDLDSPLLLARDRAPGLRYENSSIHVPAPEVWG